MKQIDLNLLTALDALLQEGSVSRAARRIGLSTPAMSHALSRAREQLEDPLLVRSGREMVLTPYAESLRDRVRAALAEAQGVLEPERPLELRSLRRSFTIQATDHTITVLGSTLDRLARAEAPRVTLRFLPTAPDDSVSVRDGECDLAIGIYGELPPELRIRQLFTERFVCVVRKDHPSVGKRLSVEHFVQLEHVQIAPRGKPGGYLDEVLQERGLERHVARAVPFFLAALQLTSESDCVLTVSERLAKAMAERFNLRILEVPVPLKPYALSMLWHPRLDGDPAHRWLREVVARTANAAASDTHEGARTRLSQSDWEAGRTRKPHR